MKFIARTARNDAPKEGLCKVKYDADVRNALLFLRIWDVSRTSERSLKTVRVFYVTSSYGSLGEGMNENSEEELSWFCLVWSDKPSGNAPRPGLSADRPGKLECLERALCHRFVPCALCPKVEVQ